MKRKLVDYKDFETMKEDSLSTVVNELIEAQDHLARTLGVESLVLESVNDQNVIYQKGDGTFLRSDYRVEGERITFDNIEELVIDEASANSKRREVVNDLLSAILEDKDANAAGLLEKYMELASDKYKREGTLVPSEADPLDEAHVRLYGTRGHNGPKVFVRKGAKDPKKSAAAKKAHRLHGASYKAGGKKRHSQLASERSRRKVNSHSYSRLHALSGGKQYGRGKKHLNEWLTLTENVFQYADIVENGYVLSESITRQDAKGNLTSVSIPTTKARNEAKLIKMHFDKMIKQDSPKVMREAGLRLANDAGFAKAVSELKRHNNLSDTAALEDTLGSVVQNFPSVLFLTQQELAKTIGTALENAGVVNFDDNTCSFMAEGILRTAHHAYSERVEKLYTLANVTPVESKDAFVDFQSAMGNYFPSLDESIATEMKVYEDLYNAVLDVRKIALESRNDEVRSEASEIVSELELVLGGKAAGSVEFAVEVADWLRNVVEANLPGASDTWTVVKTPHDTVVGDHPQMATNAKVDGIPSKFPGDWDDPAPQIGQEKMKYSHANSEEARNRSWGNKGGKDVWPSLENPNVPKPYGDYVMKGAESVADDDQWGNGSGDTWPGLQNPYVPKALIPKQLVDPKNAVE
jgi:hypothetical protein